MSPRYSVDSLTDSALTTLQARYLQKRRRGNESPTQMLQRVAVCASAVEAPSKRLIWKKKFLGMMKDLRFLPNSPTLMNSGKTGGQLSACFVLPIEDSLDLIFDALKGAALIHQSGGGTGFGFSNLRAKGSVVQATQGVASGPVSFMQIFDTATETIKQGGARRGANMAVLRVDHPDIVEFIDSKIHFNKLMNFNLSVGITDEFMSAVRSRDLFSLRDPKTRKVVKQVGAEELFIRMVDSAWACGDPGLVFLDRMNHFNPTPKIGSFESTNPCGEQPLLAYESCNLGSLNLASYWHREFGWGLFRDDVATAVRLLDNIIDANEFPLEKSREITLANRKIGLGVMGFADLLVLMGISYDSQLARIWGEKIMSVLDRTAKQASMQLAKEKGAFRNWKGSMWKKLDYPPLRNATVSTVAPTGTLSLIAGVASGIEPFFAPIVKRNVLSGRVLTETYASLSEVMRGHGHDEVSDKLLKEAIGESWCPTNEVSVQGHIQMQACFQRHSDSAVSKTINLPKQALQKDVAQAYLLAHETGCKGITIYRDGSRPTQVLERFPKDSESGLLDPCPSC